MAEGPPEEAFVLPESAAITEEAEGDAAQAAPPEEPEAAAKPQVEETKQQPPRAALTSPGVGKGISFTFLDGTSISFASTGVKLKKEERHELDMIRRIADLIGEDGSSARAAAAVSGVIELLLKRGLITYDEIKNIMEKLERIE